MLYDLKVYPRWGGTNAAPVFKAIAEPVLEYLGVPRRYGAKEEPQDTLVTVPNLRMREAAQAVEALLASGALESGGGERPVRHGPDAEARLPGAGGLHGHPPPDQRAPAGTVRARARRPGMGLRDAVATLAGMGFEIEATGSGVAVAQEPRPGALALYGSPVRVRFEADPAF